MVALSPRLGRARFAASPAQVAPWIPVAWVALLFVSSFRFSGYRDVREAVSGTASVENLIEILVYGIVGTLALVRLVFRTPRFNPIGVGLFAAFALLSLASVTWSLVPLFSLIRSSQLVVLASLVAVSAGLWTTGQRSRERDWSRIWLTYLGLSVLVSAASFIWPNWQTGRWAWPGMHTGNTSEFIAIGAMVMLSMQVESGWEVPRWVRRVLPFAFVGSLVLLAMSITRSSLFGFVVGAALILWTGSRVHSDKRIITFGLLAAAATGVFAWFSEGLAEYLLRGQTTEQFYNFTGRTDLWAFAFSTLEESPILGFGYGAARVVLIDAFWWAGTGHNLWVEAALSVGLLGAVILTAALVWMGLRSYALQRTNPGLASNVGIGFVVSTLVSGFASTNLALPGLNFATAGLVLAGLSVHARLVTRDDEARIVSLPIDDRA